MGCASLAGPIVHCGLRGGGGGAGAGGSDAGADSAPGRSGADQLGLPAAENGCRAQAGRLSGSSSGPAPRRCASHSSSLRSPPDALGPPSDDSGDNRPQSLDPDSDAAGESADDSGSDAERSHDFRPAADADSHDAGPIDSATAPEPPEPPDRSHEAGPDAGDSGTGRRDIGPADDDSAAHDVCSGADSDEAEPVDSHGSPPEGGEPATGPGGGTAAGGGPQDAVALQSAPEPSR